VDLSFLLNLLDGILENPGRIVIMTSNCPEKLDAALIRPGRIDVMATFGYCTHKTIQEMLEFFYDQRLTFDHQQALQEVRSKVLTPAEVSRVCFEHFTDLEGSLGALQELSAAPILSTAAPILSKVSPTLSTAAPTPSQTTPVEMSSVFVSEDSMQSRPLNYTTQYEYATSEPTNLTFYQRYH
jgi:hypothetical protein